MNDKGNIDRGNIDRGNIDRGNSDRENIDNRRKQLRYRANHRGIKEMDIILGGYADQFIHQMSWDELDSLDELMDKNDRDLLQWFTAEIEVPPGINTQLFNAILAFATKQIDSENTRN